MEMTKEQFINEIKELNEGTTFNISSSDIGNVTLYLRGCLIKASLEDGVDGELTIFKTYTDMEVSIDFDIVDYITKQDNIYTLSFRNGLTVVDIEVVV